MAFALIDSVSVSGAGTTGAIDTSGADLLVACAAWTSAADLDISVADSQSNVWVAVNTSTARIITANTTAILSLYFVRNPTTNASHTFTVTDGSPSLCVAAFSGADLGYPLGAATGASTAASVTSTQAGSLTPARDACLLIAAASYRSTNALGIDGGFTIAENVVFASGTAVGSGLAYLIQTTATAANPTWSWTTGTAASSILAEFQTLVEDGGSPSVTSGAGPLVGGRLVSR